VDSLDRVFSHIRGERIAAVTSDLIKISSINPPGNEEELARWTADFMKDMGMDVMIQPVARRRANTVGKLRGRERKGCLVFSGHLDVVPVSREEQSAWRTDPFQPVIEQGRLFGRGAADAKGGAAAILCAVEAIQKARIPIAGDIMVALSADEEGTMLGVRTLTGSGVLREARAVVVAEPSDNRLCLSSRGQTSGWVNIDGQTAHTSLQDAGVNAIHAAARFIDRLLGRRPSHQPHPVLGESYWTVTMIHGGAGESIVPDSCGLHIDGRLVPGQNAQQFWDDVETVLQEMAEADDTFSARINILGEAAAWETPPDSILAETAKRAIQKTLGKEPEVMGFPATTDGAYFHSQLGIPVAILGPGSLSSSHGANEFVSVEQLEEAARIYAACVLEYWNTEGDDGKPPDSSRLFPVPEQ